MTTRSEFPFAFPFRVRYSEIDGQSIVFNAHYLTYFDITITEFMRWLGYDYVGEVKETGQDFHTVKTLVEYKAPIYFDEEIEVAHLAAELVNLVVAERGDVFVGELFAGEIHPLLGRVHVAEFAT